MSELQDDLTTIERLVSVMATSEERDALITTVKAARRVANLDMNAATSVLEGAYDIPPVTAKIMAQYTVFAALGITTEDSE